MAKQKIYLETSVISLYFDFKNQDPIGKAITREFWQDVLPKYENFISPIVIRELTTAKDPKWRRQFLELAETLDSLDLTSEIEELATKYVKSNLFPEKKRPDALHIAVASTNKIDFLASWNQEHITRAHRKKLIQDFNIHKGVFVPAIVTPEELLISQKEEK